MEYGIWTLIPVLFVIAFALKTKRTLEPLIFGTLLTYVITSAARIPSEGVYALSHIATDWMDAFFRVATDYSHQWVFLVCALFGSLITLLGESHGTLGFTRALGKLCRGPRSTMMVTWITGTLPRYKSGEELHPTLYSDSPLSQITRNSHVPALQTYPYGKK